MHASGHASGPELLEIVRTLAPKTVFPVHTEHPEAFRASGARVRLPELATAYSLAD
jgi:ribonuclease J